MVMKNEEDGMIEEPEIEEFELQPYVDKEVVIGSRWGHKTKPQSTPIRVVRVKFCGWIIVEIARGSTTYLVRKDWLKRNYRPLPW